MRSGLPTIEGVGMSRISIQALLALIVPMVVVGLSVGCTSERTKAPKRIDEDALMAHEYPQITVSRGLKGTITAGDIVEEAGPPVRVTVPVRALTRRRDLHVQYRFMFLDEKGLPLNREPDWHYMRMPSRTQVFMQGNALDANAQDWRLEIRLAR